jgi:predicted DCC family thiol-disulfide oxidoreductase YuxK
MPDSSFEVFYDGECPLCKREIGALKRLDRHARIRFTDIAALSGAERARQLGLEHEQLMARIHGRTADGEIVEGVEVFRKLYEAVGFGPVVALTRLPGVRSALDAAYGVFARNRLKLTGRCTTEQCDVASSR